MRRLLCVSDFISTMIPTFWCVLERQHHISTHAEVDEIMDDLMADGDAAATITSEAQPADGSPKKIHMFGKLWGDGKRPARRSTCSESDDPPTQEETHHWHLPPMFSPRGSETGNPLTELHHALLA
jgi:hypothetical protein